MMGDIRQAESIYIACGKTDMRKGIQGLIMLIQQNYSVNPYGKSLFLFCGNKKNKIKAVMYEPDGWVMIVKSVTEGSFKWPKTPNELRELNWNQFTWLMQGLSIEQPKAIKPSSPKLLV